MAWPKAAAGQTAVAERAMALLAAWAKELPAASVVGTQKVEARLVVALAVWFAQNRATKRTPNLPTVI